MQSYTVKGLPVFEAGQALSYRAAQADDLSNYLTAYKDGDENTIVNTLKTAFSVAVKWRDEATTTATDNGTRPTADDYTGYLTLYRKSTQPGDKEETMDTASIQVSESAISAAGLPAYDALGYPYEYYVVQNGELSQNTELGAYKAEVINAASYGSETVKAFDGATIVNAITGKTYFAINKVWVVGGRPADERPDVTFYLYRFVREEMADGIHFAAASPVKGEDNKALPDKSDEYTFEYATGLPRYDELGREYVYFANEKMADQGDYVIDVVDKSLEDEGKYYNPNNDTVINQLQGQVAPTVTKIWKAKALQGMDATETFQLYRQSAAAGSAAEKVETNGQLLIEGFTAERMAQTSTFPSQPKYDDNGYEYMHTPCRK